MKKYLTKIPITIALLLLTSFASSAEPMSAPVIEWARVYFQGNFSRFYDVIETSDGGFLVAGFRMQDISSPGDSCLFKFNSSGTLQWAIETEFFNKSLRKVLQVNASDFVALGAVKALPTSNISLLLFGANSNGEILWTKVYELSDSEAYGYDLVSLPDGGFAICGEIDPVEGMNQAWILRTDSQGDTLWTREWGWDYNDKAMKVLYIDNGLTVLTHGRLESTSAGPHIVRYDMNGNLLWETDIPELAGDYGQDMCRASDGGLLVLDNYHPDITHTDIYGNYDWQFCPPGWGSNYGWSVNTTMDGGIIFGGENAWSEPNGSKSDLSGMISRHDSLGNELWRDYVYNSGCVAIYSVRQLSHGGYIAAGEAFSPENGVQGFLIKYAPELGIENGDYPSVVTINAIAPNPLSSSATIQFSLIEAGIAKLTLYDLNGREIDIISEGIFAGGINTVNWNTPVGLSSGYYLMRIDTANGCGVKSCVLLR